MPFVDECQGDDTNADNYAQPPGEECIAVRSISLKAGAYERSPPLSDSSDSLFSSVRTNDTFYSNVRWWAGTSARSSITRSRCDFSSLDTLGRGISHGIT